MFVAHRLKPACQNMAAPEDVQRAMARVLRPQAMSVVVVAGPPGFQP